jgi:tetratricopeptide (TPR) repeat protein/septal ring-binding cell division protein DamX
MSMLLLLLALLPSMVVAAVAGGSEAAKVHIASGDRYAEAGQNFLAAREYRQAIALGFDGANVHWKLSLSLYGLGLVDEAISEISTAQELSPDVNYLHLPTGILHLAKGSLDEAARHFVAALLINPGFADAYYYLGEVYYRQGDYQRAWLCESMAKTLGHPGGSLRHKLEAVSAAPRLVPWREDPGVLHLRLIKTSSREEAQSVFDRLAAGELFEYIAAERGAEANQGFGGYAGIVVPGELDPAIAEALLGQDVFHPPLVVETAGGYQILQRIAPFDPGYWDQLLSPSKKSAPTIAAAPNTTGPAAAETTYYRLYAGSYGTESTARKRVAELEQHGFAADLYRQESASGKNLHVIAGRYPNHKEAQEAAARLKSLKIDHYISEVKGPYRAPSAKDVDSATEPTAATSSEPLSTLKQPAIAPAPAMVTSPEPLPSAFVATPTGLASTIEPAVSPAEVVVLPTKSAVAALAPIEAEPLPAPPQAMPTEGSISLAEPTPGPDSASAPLNSKGMDVTERPPLPSAPPAVASSQVTDGMSPAVRLTAPGKRLYRIHAGSYSVEANAQNKLTQLKRHDFTGYIFRQETPSGKNYHVVAGKYATRQEAVEAAARLTELGIDHYISGGK